MAAASKSPFNSDSRSDSDFAKVYVLQSTIRERPGNSSISLNTNAAALLQASKSDSRLLSRRSYDLVCAKNFDASAPVLDGTVQLVLTDRPYNVWRLTKSKNFGHDSLSAGNMKNTVKLIVDLQWPGGNAILFCIAQQLAVWHVLFCAHKFTQNDGSSLSSASMPRDTFVVRAAPVKFENDPLHHCDDPARRLYASAIAVKLALHVKKNGLPLAAEENMVNYKQFGSERSAFSGYKNLIKRSRAWQ